LPRRQPPDTLINSRIPFSASLVCSAFAAAECHESIDQAPATPVRTHRGVPPIDQPAAPAVFHPPNRLHPRHMAAWVGGEFITALEYIALCPARARSAETRGREAGLHQHLAAEQLREPVRHRRADHRSMRPDQERWAM
jgi:hypothetical protein